MMAECADTILVVVDFLVGRDVEGSCSLKILLCGGNARDIKKRRKGIDYDKTKMGLQLRVNERYC